MISNHDLSNNTLADKINPSSKSRMTYRQENSYKRHNIPIGSVVSISGATMFVIAHTWDFDDEPLYILSDSKVRPYFDVSLGGFLESELERIT